MKKLTDFFNPISIKINWKDSFMRSSIIYLFLLLFSSQSFAQVVLPPTDIVCPSNDLEVISAILPAPANDPCNCTGTRTLQLGIINKTGSDRTAFAMWGKLIRKDASGNPIGSPETIFACASGILASTTQYYPTTTTITIACNQSLEIVDVILAWTSANKKENCDFLKNNPSTINPKCGRADTIRVETGVDADLVETDATCTTLGSIVTTPYGGKAPYTYSWTASEGGFIPTGQSDDQNLSGLIAGKYTLTITDANNCNSTRIREIKSTGSVSTPVATVTQPTCSVATGTVTISSPVSGITYTLSQSGTTKYTANTSGVFSSVIAGTYVLKATNGTCAATGDNVIVDTQPVTPAAPSSGGNQTECEQSPIQTLTATATAPSGGSIQWFTTVGGTTTATPTLNSVGTVTYFAEAVSSDGCHSLSRTAVTLTINPVPVITLSANPVSINTAITTTSQLGIASISPGVISDYDYSWSIFSKPGGSDASLTNPSTATPVLNILSPYTPGSYVVQVTATHKTTGCSNTKSITVPVPARGDLPCSIDGASLVCPGTANTYNGPSPIPDGYTYTWSVTGDGTIVGATNGTSFQVQASSSCNTSYTVKLHIQSSSGVISTDCEKTVSVKDDIIPVLAAAPSAVTVQCIGDVPAMTSLIWTDNCSAGGSVSGVDGSLVGGACGGTITRTWNVSDACGNAAVTRTQIITVRDNIPPTITFCPADIVIEACNNALTLPANTGSATATDNCSSVTPTYEDAITLIGSCYTKLITRTWTAADACGNSVTCVQRITVRDNTAPVITCNADGSASATDNCSTNVQLYFSNGMWTAIDESGNISTHEACPVLPGNNQTTAVTEQTNQSVTNTKTIHEPLAKELKVQAYPNPFSSKVKFMITSPVKGRGTLDVYNATGQKVRTVHTDFMVAGIQTVELSFPSTQVTNLVYVLRIGDKQVTGKLLKINQ